MKIPYLCVFLFGGISCWGGRSSEFGMVSLRKQNQCRGVGGNQHLRSAVDGVDGFHIGFHISKVPSYSLDSVAH